MPEHFLNIEPRDPVILRDGRPFGADSGTKMRTLPWPYPQTVTGTVRTILGKAQNQGFGSDGIALLLNVAIAGVFPQADQTLYFHSPADLLLRPDVIPSSIALRPEPGSSGNSIVPSELPALAALPRGIPEFKPTPTKAFVSSEWLAKWLVEQPVPADLSSSFNVDVAESEQRQHVAIDPSTAAAQDEMLFSTVGLRLKKGFSMSARVRGDEAAAKTLESLRSYHPFGGERRLAWFERVARPAAGWSCPASIQSAFAAKPQRIRMMLATPGLFASGWIPEWLQRQEPVPGTNNLRLRLVSAAVERWLPVSGWSYDRRTFGAKSLRRLTPAGTVYFCELLPGSDPTELAALWLEPVSDAAQDRRDGYGLAIWGIWNYHA